MTLATLVLRGIRYHRRLHLGLVVGTAIACATLTGALVVGDSVRSTLYTIATDRLGEVTHALDWGNRYFDAQLARDMAGAHDEAVGDGDEKPSPGTETGVLTAVLALRGVAESPPEKAAAADRVNRARVYGVDSRFWRLLAGDEAMSAPGPQEVFINEAIAGRLGVRAGDDMILRLAKPSLLPSDAPLASDRDGAVAVARVRVLKVLPDGRGGRFALATDQAMPENVFLDRDWLAGLVELDGRANMLLAGGGATLEGLESALRDAWHPGQVGLRVRSHPSGIVQLESERLFIEDAVVRAAQRLGPARLVLTYLVNSIAHDGRATPYSFVAAGVAPGDIPAGEVGINPWLADHLQAAAGDTLAISWFEPLPSGEYAERHAEARVHEVLPMDLFLTEKEMALQFPGLSGVDSCRDWDIGLPLEEEKLLDEANEAYWIEYGQMPKLVVSFETGSAWWGNHFGSVMAVRFPADEGGPDQVLDALGTSLDPAALGLVFSPVREQALQAVEQAMDFGALFAGLSMFLIAASLALLALLYAHGLQMRAGEMGTLLAAGWTPGRVRIWLLAESLPTLAAGVCAGTLGGAAYARLLLYGLVRFWPAAVADTPLRFHAAPLVLVQGATVTVVCILAVLALCVYRASRRTVRELLHRDFSTTAPLSRPGRAELFYWAAVLTGFPAAAASLYLGVYGDTRNPTVWFFAAGAALLCAALAAYAVLLGRLVRRPAPARPRLLRLVLGQVARRRGRSLGVALITGCGVFMVLSVASMQAAMTDAPEERSSGAGGFTVFAATTVAVRADEDSILGFSRDRIVPLRVWDGDDAGCLNLNRAERPRLYGVDPALMIERRAFTRENEAEALWSLLREPLEDGVYPALVGDTDTALWGLQAVTDPVEGTEFSYVNDRGDAFRLRTVGRLPMRLSVFQGSLLVSEENFVRLFPHEGGYRGFLVETGNAGETAARMNREHGRLGMEAVASGDRLRAFHAVERSYLAMFLVLGGLGMMLGAGGAAVIALRNLAERRPEFALLLALGFEPALVRRMALLENTCLVAAGLVIGGFSAAVAVLPLLLETGASLDYGVMAMVLAGVFLAYFIAVLSVTRIFLSRIPLSALRTE